MANHTILISVVDATGCVLRIYQMDSEASMKQLMKHFTEFACPLCTNTANITFWHEDTQVHSHISNYITDSQLIPLPQISALHTPSTLDLPPFAKITIRPSMLCATSTTLRGHTLPVLHHFSPPLVHLHGGTFTPTPLGGSVFPFGPEIHGQRDREVGWERREELRMKILDLKKQEKDLIRKIVVGSVYEKYALNAEVVRENVERLVEERERVGEWCRAVEEELEREGRRDSVWVS
ncbi:hypothetical protein CLAFUW4_12215 [Fulvia fulva]|uniref:uncharacterized protein n=1 Tax=Passalora fulva TaxID=5499 RepID=UPI0004E9C1C7|nr:uncharacterized protein CLAFUR5_20332 [Fulvia fulva]KAK4618346.1 hypothetical protein CLAFUR4_12220 [Fulvia fulva]KAK4619149.1 hypothetical protein CLAFUR0_12231 [Fulvia fulva]WMI38983.1 hypothetical protein CLAFUR5_20332 [Fulvia fulva]WPV17876.1 hypothetical protein CLAFUW4_12215 [Fulvia fulva]WPV33287.1 hypothetical protein CLAFUW7_12222 [Fulvia fulva]